jgi:hypothetical protein
MAAEWQNRWKDHATWTATRGSFLNSRNVGALAQTPTSEHPLDDPRERPDLRGFDFRGTNEWQGFNFEGCDLREADFSGVNLRNVRFAGARLDGARFDGADLTEADLHRANLDRASLVSAILHGAQLKDASLQKADCRSASFFRTSLFRANLAGADLRGAWLESALLRDADLNGVRIETADGFVRTDVMTRLPFRRLAWLHPHRAFLRDEVDADYAAAERIYMQLQSLVREAGQREQSGELFYRARWCRRLALPRRTDRVWELWFKQWLIGFGERILRPVWVGIVSIFVFAGIFWLAGNITYGTQQISGPQAGVTNTSKLALADCVNYSAKTFTTLGYSDSLPDFSGVQVRSGIQRALWSWLPTFEALTAACLVSLFAAIAFRKIVRD